MATYAVVVIEEGSRTIVGSRTGIDPSQNAMYAIAAMTDVVDQVLAIAAPEECLYDCTICHEE